MFEMTNIFATDACISRRMNFDEMRYEFGTHNKKTFYIKLALRSSTKGAVLSQIFYV
jgi:hypothetical protein